MEIEVPEFGVRIKLTFEPMEKPEEEQRVDQPEVDNALDHALRQWRREEAIRRGVPTYIVMSERTIRVLIKDQPVTKDEIVELKGIGPKTWDLYGEVLLAIIKEAQGAIASE